MKDTTPVSLKKRRRDSGKDESSTSGRNSTPVRLPIDIWTYEEEEAERRDADKDLLLYKQTSAEIRRIMRDILELKINKRSDGEITEKRIQASLLFITLKKLNRLEKLKSKKCRDATNEAKHRVDSFHLQLQNLLYESLHLKKEVDKCVEFKSKDEEIELVSVEEFYREAPEHICKPEITKKDTHQLMLARLHWELVQRQQLAEKYKDACLLKAKINTEIREKRQQLEELAPRLSAILQATRPLQEYLDIPLNVKRQENKTARLLPSPLFILHMQANAYHEACDPDIFVSIDGDVDEARAVKYAAEDREDDSGDSDVEDVARSKRHRRRTTDRLANSRKKLLQKHPLTIVVNIKCQGNNSVILNFAYLMSLNIVTVTYSLKCRDSIPEGDLLSLDSLLLCLTPEDTGDQTPNPTNHFQLQKLGMRDFKTYISEIGRPYRWVQLLAGLEYPSDDDGVANLHEFIKSDAKVSANYIGSTINAIRDRVNSRLALQQQVTSLARGMIPASPLSSRFPAKITARFVSWKSTIWEEFLTDKRRTKLVESGLLSPGHILFSAQIEKGSAKLKAQVNISPNYPATTPLFHLNITWKNERDAHDAALRVMEREINVFCAPSDNSNEANYLLTSQVQQLLMCFEVYLETSTGDSAFEGPVEFPKEKTFIRANSGRDRSKPYKFVHNLGFFVHR